jgi:hypothetical protein
MENDTRSESNASVLRDPLTEVIRRLRDPILLLAIGYAIVLAYVAISDRLTYETGSIILATFILALVAYVIVDLSRPSSSPPGRVTKETDLQEHVQWQTLKETLLPDPLTTTRLRWQIERLSFTIPMSVSSNVPLWICVEMWSEYQSIVFVPDVKVERWNWKSFRREPVNVSLNDARIIQTVGKDRKEELEFHARYRILLAIKDTSVRKKLPIYYQLYASSDRKHWEDMSGPRTIYATITSDEGKAKEILGIK